MLEHRTSELCIFHGANVMEIVAWLERTPRVWTLNTSRDERSSSEWDLNAGYAKSLELARNGWHEGVEQMHSRLRAIPPPITSHAKLSYDIAGHFPDVPRYLGGEPAHMVTRGRDKGQRPVITLAVDRDINSMQKASHAVNFGAAMCSIVDKLEASGRRVEVDTVFATQFMAGGRYIGGWNVKRAGEALDLSTLAFGLAHPAAQRRINFAMEERTHKKWEHPGYGRAVHVNKTELAIMGLDEAFLIDVSGRQLENCYSLDAATEFALRQINKAAGEVIAEIDP